MRNFSLLSVQSPVDCAVLKPLGVYCVLLFVVSLACNTKLLLVFAQNKKLMTPVNYVLYVIAIVNLAATFVEVPLVATNAFLCRFAFGRHVCYFTAFVMHFSGLFSITSTVSVSVLRYIIARYCFIMQPLKWQFSVHSLNICAIISIAFSMMPLLGWSHYSLEGAHIGCSIEWKTRSLSVSSYNITMFALFFIVPLILLIFTNARLICIYRESRESFRECHNAKQLNKSLKDEKKLKLISHVLLVGFLVSWTPYALVSMFTAFVDADSIGPLFATIPSLLAKTSLVWPSLLFLCTSKEIKMNPSIMNRNSNSSSLSLAKGNPRFTSLRLNQKPARTV